MRKLKNKQLLNNFIYQEITSKFFIKPLKLAALDQTININFKLSDIKLIKNIIAFELLSAKRPTIKASIWKKTIIINMKNSFNLELLSFLQKSPIIWSRYLNKTMNITEALFSNSLTVKNNKLLITTINKVNKIDFFIKSAYLD